MSQDFLETIRQRRSIKGFTPRPVTREEIEPLLELAVLAPNHRLTEPWGFVVLGVEARRRFGEIKGRRRAAKVEDPAAAEAVLRKTIESEASVPLMIAFTQRLSTDAEVREEDFATVCMAIQNFLLGAAATGLGGHIKTGAILNAPETLAALDVPEGERVVALVEVGEPAVVPALKPRAPATSRTRWLP